MDIDIIFAYTTPSVAVQNKIRLLRDLYVSLKRTVEDEVPAGRERSIAITELETSAMWAVKALVATDPGEADEQGITIGPPDSTA